MGYYIHQVPGRLRVKAPLIARCPTKGEDLRVCIQLLTGVRSAEVNKHASCITVQYDPNQLDADAILEVLKERGCLERDATSHRPQAVAKVGELFGKAVFDVLLAKTVERSVLSLVTAFR
jgi:copper chaperone CopZ